MRSREGETNRHVSLRLPFFIRRSFPPSLPNMNHHLDADIPARCFYLNTSSVSVSLSHVAARFRFCSGRSKGRGFVVSAFDQVLPVS